MPIYHLPEDLIRHFEALEDQLPADEDTLSFGDEDEALLEF